MNENLPPNIKFWLDGPDHDCYFVVGPESDPTERIGALKIFLKGHSEPMRAMFGGSEIAETGDVRVKDVEPDTFKTFLKCIYGGSDFILPNLNFEECAKLLYVAEKYLVSDIKTRTAKRMSELLNPTNLFIAFSYPVCFQDDTLSPTILHMFRTKAKEIISNEHFMSANSKDLLLWILEQETFNVREIEIWKAVLKWGRNRCSNGEDLRSQLAPLLSRIRFLTMESKEFWRDVTPCEVLSKEEVYEICKSFGTGIPHSMSQLSCNTNPRNRAIVSDKIMITSLETSSKSMSIFCKIINLSKLHADETSESFEWSGYRWSITIGKTKEKNEYSLNCYVNCEKEGDYCLYVKVRFTFVGKREYENIYLSKWYNQDHSAFGSSLVSKDSSFYEFTFCGTMSLEINVDL